LALAAEAQGVRRQRGWCGALFYLAQDGDAFEQRYWTAFLAIDFPSYERFWQNRVVPLTNRPADIHFKSAAVLQAAGFSDHNICCAQLHYTILRHLSRAFEFRRVALIDLDLLTEGLARLNGAQDVAFELLERCRDPSLYDPWLESGKRGRQAARRKWQGDHGFPLQDLRDYRNHLLHGRMTPAVFASDVYVPRVGRESAYFDWRLITDGTSWQGQLGADLVPCRVVLDDAWKRTVVHLESEWTKHFP